ncbi:MAG: alpha/beta-type small acid-soluble spore protein [Lachnospiraceae bacterium]
MNGTNNSSKNQMAHPQAKEAMSRFKEEVASEIGVPLRQGYNGDLTSAQAGSIGGEMVRKMIKKQEEEMSSRQ